MKQLIKINKIKVKIKGFKAQIHKKLQLIKACIGNNIIEITAFIGLFFILYATYKVNHIAFLYTLGFIFCAFSIFLFKYPKKIK